MKTPFDRNDIPQALLIFGCLMLWYGASRLGDGVAALVVGVVIILYIRPLRTWWSR